ncbi:MAG: hypothetical protein ACTIMI_11320 [Brochothrix thermosphacta]
MITIHDYEWLRLYNDTMTDIDILELEIECKEKELSRWLDGGDLEKTQTFLTSLEKQGEIKEVINNLKTKLEEKQSHRDKIVTLIERFEGLDNRILIMRYVDELSLSEIALLTGYSYQYIRDRHARLKKIIEFNGTKL